MNFRHRALWLLAIQCGIVCLVAANYWYQRATLPRVWVRAEQVDPESLIRGRYLMLAPLVNACDLPRNEKTKSPIGQWDYTVRPAKRLNRQVYQWTVRTTARDGKLVITDATEDRYKSNLSRVSYTEGNACNASPMQSDTEVYLPENAKAELPAGGKGEIWLEVSVPRNGPPRPIQLATKINDQWKVIVR